MKLILVGPFLGFKNVYVIQKICAKCATEILVTANTVLNTAQIKNLGHNYK